MNDAYATVEELATVLGRSVDETNAKLHQVNRYGDLRTGMNAAGERTVRVSDFINAIYANVPLEAVLEIETLIVAGRH